MCVAAAVAAAAVVAAFLTIAIGYNWRIED